MRARLAIAAGLVLIVATGSACSDGDGPIQAIKTMGAGVRVDNLQHSGVWTVAGFTAGSEENIDAVHFVEARLVNGSGDASVRAGVDLAGDAGGGVEPTTLPDGYVPIPTDGPFPATSCSAASGQVQFAFEVTSDSG